MKYELIRDGNVGVLIDPTPIFSDIKDTFTVSFILPESGAYVALFRDEKGIEYKTIIGNERAQIPKELLKKEQRVGLTVCKVDGDNILRVWECQSMQTVAFLRMRQTQWQITAGVDDKELYARLAQIEQEFANSQKLVNELMAQNTVYKNEIAVAITEFNTTLNMANTALASHKTSIETLTQSYNNAIEVINNLSERLAALESNYDPTVIKGV